MSKDHWTPEFKEQRRWWLRNKHRQPLEDRFIDVLGEEELHLLHKLREVYNQHGEGERGFELYARHVLRSCSRVPAGARRRAYLQKCIANLNPVLPEVRYTTVYIPEQDYWEVEEVEPEGDWLEQISRKSGLSVQAVREWLFKLALVYIERWHGDDERVRGDMLRITMNAAAARYPLEYIRAVLRNEKAAIKERKKSRVQRVSRRQIRLARFCRPQ